MYPASQEDILDTGGIVRTMSRRRRALNRDFDVVIVGSGVAGALAAYKLAQAGAQVLILEAGSRNPARAKMMASYAIASTPKPLHSPYIQNESDTKAPSPDSSGDYYDQPNPPM